MCESTPLRRKNSNVKGKKATGEENVHIEVYYLSM